uniref:Uncharacterized protein n=1 Tax=Oryza brachyantha TaxID=4533 RepID=J3NBB5_ORYBR
MANAANPHRTTNDLRTLPSSHFLVVAYGIQSHINPAQDLAHRLARIDDDGSVTCTLSTHVSAHRGMFPSSLASPDEETTDGIISYAPFSDGFFGDRSKLISVLSDEETARSRRASFESLSSVVSRLPPPGPPPPPAPRRRRTPILRTPPPPTPPHADVSATDPS